MRSKLATMVLAVTTTVVMSIGGVVYAAEATLLNTYGNMFGKIGASAEYGELCDSSVQNYFKGKYNSTTLGNHMKPDFILSNWSPKMISVAQARSMGYYIPSNYKESTVPQLNFNEVDNALKVCAQQGLSLRGHTLLWHSQTPDWFFRAGYNKNAGYVSQEVMDARTEMYIKTVMNHVHKHQYGKVVYAWDVVNEYLHASDTSGWVQIYGKPSPYAGFIKRAFQYAHEALVDLGLQNSVSLFYNDYNTYLEADDVVKLINNINSNGKICNGVGMQSHLGTDFPSVAFYSQALNKFAKAGFEIQITELDVTNTSEDVQAKYLYDLFTEIIKTKKAGGNITGITLWGLHDGATWIPGKNPLIFKDLNTPKKSYYSILQAYKDQVGEPTDSTPTPEVKPNPNYVTLKDGWYYIKGVGSNKYLQVADNKGGNGVNVEIGTGTGVAGQKWYLTNTQNGYVTLKNGQGYTLDVVYGKDEDKANIQTYTANGMSAQEFKILPTSKSGVYGIVTRCSTDVRGLDVENKGTTDGSNVIQYGYYGAANQTWIFEPCDGTSSTPETKPETSGNALTGKITSDWGSGAVADITVTNTTNSDLNSWTVTFTSSRPITSVWNATIVSQSGNTYTVTGPEWQKGLEKGASYTFGCQLAGSGDLTFSNITLK